MCIRDRGEDKANPKLLNFFAIVGDTTFVDAYPDGISQYGVYNMAGNVEEWVNDWFTDTYYQNSPASNPLGPISSDGRVLRGGSWINGGSNVRASSRVKDDPSASNGYYGFRCARGISP